MIFNPLFNLVKTNTDGVRFFLCNLFYQNNCQLNKEDADYISEKLEDFKNYSLHDTDSFIELFNSNVYLYKVLSELKSENKYGFFTNNKRVYISTLDGPSLALTICYLNTFGYDNVKN